MASKFNIQLRMRVKSFKKIKVEIEKLGTWYVFPVPENPGGIPDQAMPIPAISGILEISGTEKDKSKFPPMKKVSPDDIRKMVAFGAKIYTGEKDEKNGPGK